MTYISTTGLRTKSTELISSLLAGKSVDLFHRSKLVGKILPVKHKTTRAKKTFSWKDLPHFEGLTSKEAMANYDNHMHEKYGKSLR